MHRILQVFCWTLFSMAVLIHPQPGCAIEGTAGAAAAITLPEPDKVNPFLRFDHFERSLIQP